MKAAIVTRFGPPSILRLEDRPRPVPRPGEVLVRVRATPVTAGDMRLRAGLFPRGLGLVGRAGIALSGSGRPIPGWGFAGIVEIAAGPFAQGARVFGISGVRGGSHADFVAVPAEGKILPLPESLSLEEGAAFFFGGLTAMDFLMVKSALRSGQSLLVNGATGAVGSAALQIARHLGLRITAVCRRENHDLARSLGADILHDYRDGPVAGPFDAVLDVAGTLPWRRARPLLAEGGVLLPVTADLAGMLGAALRPRRGSRRIAGATTAETREAMERLVALHAAGAYRPVLGDILPFERIAEAHALAETMHRRGATVLTLP